MKAIVFIVLNFFSIAAYCQKTTVAFQFVGDGPFEAKVTVEENLRGKLHAFINLFDYDQDGRIHLASANQSTVIDCIRTDIASCVFHFTENYPQVAVHLFDRSFYADQALQDFSGVDVLIQNPTLSLDLKFESYQDPYTRTLELKMGAGKFFAGGREKRHYW